ncbi:hypothetical protein SLOPH_224 [Spraguea lophii 42_110]|uniref:Uncharacterized protein n=1 Tax=Spraguea lophii (strain 42_110) TaxID=1358809 RepID=S7W669_SPRLO|nr:hypothetical protein SLOPH_224 [Spraguea lophii 42_110]
MIMSYILYIWLCFVVTRNIEYRYIIKWKKNPDFVLMARDGRNGSIVRMQKPVEKLISKYNSYFMINKVGDNVFFKIFGKYLKSGSSVSDDVIVDSKYNKENIWGIVKTSDGVKLRTLNNKCMRVGDYDNKLSSNGYTVHVNTCHKNDENEIFIIDHVKIQILQDKMEPKGKSLAERVVDEILPKILAAKEKSSTKSVIKEEPKKQKERILIKQPERNLIKQPEKNLTKQAERILTKQVGTNLTKQPETNLTKQPETNLIKRPERILIKRPERNLTKQKEKNLINQRGKKLPKQKGIKKKYMNKIIKDIKIETVIKQKKDYKIPRIKNTLDDDYSDAIRYISGS